MEKSIPDFLGEGGRALLMPPEPTPETFPALDHPQGEELRAAFLQDAKKSTENPALSETELEEDAFYGVEELAAMRNEGKGPELREEPDFFSSLARQEPDVALEAHDEADEPDAALSGAVQDLRNQLGPTSDAHLEFPPSLFRNVPGAVPWDSCGSGKPAEESTLEGIPGLKESPESPFSLESQAVTTVRLDPDSPDGGNSPLESPRPEIPPEKYSQNEPKRPEKSGKNAQRLDWRTPGNSRDPKKTLDGSEFRGQPRKSKGKPAEISRLEFPKSDWVVPKIGKRSWTVNVAEDSSELSLEPTPCSSFEVELRPFILLEEPEKEESAELIQEDNPDVFTCIECSIYFRKKQHLMDHMVQHNRDGDSSCSALQSRFSCGECGWNFGDPDALEQHRRLHQESREKILEEIQKLNEFPDEGREARLQCPKCVFGTNSSKIFVQHAKMHVKERKDQGSRNSNLFGEFRDNPYKSFQPDELPAAPGKSHNSCVLCGFPAPTEHILKEHMRYSHSRFSWEHPENFDDDPNQPGTSRDSYSPTRPGRFSDVEFFGKNPERFFPPGSREGSAGFDSGFDSGFGIPHPRLEKSDGSAKKDHRGFHARKAAPYPKNLGIPGFPSSKAYSQLALQQLKRRASAQHLEGDGDHWVAEEEEMDVDLATRTAQVATKCTTKPIVVPQAALDLKRTFRNTLKATEVTSEEQQHQLRMMVPVVLLEEMTTKSTKRPRGKIYKKKLLQPPPPPPPPHREFLLEDPLPLDVLLLDAPLEDPLELDDLLDSESAMLKNEERKCPYCPDRFHNGIGLANHVRGHLNRVGVSYNVRHFISAEEVKAIEQKFSFQKKKKKVANFDPSTFSLMRCEFCGAGFDTRAGLSSHARAHLRDFGITNWELTISPIHILKELLANCPQHPELLRAALAAEEREPQAFLGVRKAGGAAGAAFPAAWGEEVLQSYRDVVAPPEEALLAMEVGSPPSIPKNPLGNLPLEQQQQQQAARIGTKLSPERKAEPHEQKASSLTTCEVCFACFETRKGLSSHARSHLRQLGVAESESSGAPIDLLYELVRHKAKPEPPSSSSSSSSSSLQPALAKKSASPKDPAAVSRPLLLLKDQRPADSINKAIKSPPGFSKALSSQPGSPVLKKMPAALPAASPPPKNAEEKGAKLALSPLPAEPKGQWGAEEDGPLNLTSGSDPPRDIRCEFCGEFFENRKGLSSHARSHLRQMGITEWYVNGSPIDTLREILKRRRNPAGNPGNHPKSMAKSLLANLSPLESPRDLHIPSLAKKIPAALSSPGSLPENSPPPPPPPPPPPTARKMFAGLSFPKKMKQDQLRVEIKRELMAGGAGMGAGEAQGQQEQGWAARDEMAPLNLSSRADPVRDIRCEFCGEFFENRKGLSSHARSHLRQMGVTEWSVNGSPIDTLREILRKKSKPLLVKKEPQIPPGIETPKPDDGAEPKSCSSSSSSPIPGKSFPAGIALGKLGSAGSAGLALAPLGSKNPGAFLAPKRPLEDRLAAAPGEAKHKAFELPFKAKALHDKASEACCELCGLYFENRKALASHARAHLRQFGVTEWCVNGSPIETLREWIRHRPHKAGAYRSYIQGGRPFSKKFRNSGHSREHRGGLAVQGVARLMGKGIAEIPGEAGKGLEGSGAELGAALLVKVEEQRANISKFERRQPRPLEPALSRQEECGAEFPPKLPEARPAPRVRPVPALVPRPPRASLVKFVGNIYTLKCRFCEVEFQGPLSIQEEWVRHLQRHILEMNFSKADSCRNETPPDPPALTQTP